MAVPFPQFDAGLPALHGLRAWLEDQRARARSALEGAQDIDEVRRLQGRLELLGEMQRHTAPDRRPLQGVRSRLPSAGAGRSGERAGEAARAAAGAIRPRRVDALGWRGWPSGSEARATREFGR